MEIYVDILGITCINVQIHPTRWIWVDKFILKYECGGNIKFSLTVLLLEKSWISESFDPWYVSWNGIGTKVEFGRASAEACWNGCWDKKSWYWLADVSLWKLQQVYQRHWHNQKVVFSVLWSLSMWWLKLQYTWVIIRYFYSSSALYFLLSQAFRQQIPVTCCLMLWFCCLPSFTKY